MVSANKAHRRSIRLPNYDYTQAGAYFVTIIAHQRACLFGEIIRGEMHISSFGRIVIKEWEKLPSRFPMVGLDLMVLMPNHFHGIIMVLPEIDTAMNGNNTDLDLILKHRSSMGGNREEFGQPIPNSIPTVIRSFKAAVSLRINTIRGTQSGLVWQRNYYERVIRDEMELLKIRKYIHENPLKWDLDNENPNFVPLY